MQNQKMKSDGSLAQRVNCFDEEEMAVLAKVDQSTLAAWRKRGKGPAYLRFGNAFLYPLHAVEDYFKSKLKVKAVSEFSLV